MAVVLNSPVTSTRLDKRWSPSAFVDTSSCPSLALNSPVSTMTNDSVSSTYIPSTTEEQNGPSSTMTHEMGTSGWYGSSIPASSHYNEFHFENPYVTPHSSSLGTFSPEYPKGSESFNHVDPIKTSNSPYLLGLVPCDSLLPARPRSSPSTFSPTSGPRLEDFLWQSNGLGISHTSPMDTPYSGSSYPSNRAGRTPRMSEPALPDINAPTPRRTYPTIAPNPAGPQKVSRKRTLESEEPQEETKRRKRSDSAAVTQELNEEDKLLLQLKDEENLPWKDIAARFQTDLGKTYQIPALQMRLKRLRERLRVWTEADLRALRLAHEYWAQSKFDIIASKMIEYGASDRWSARQCARKWSDIDPSPTPYTTSYENPTPALSQYTTSPQTDAQTFMPYLHIPH